MITLPQWMKDWFIEAIQRTKMKRPKFFRNVGRIGDVLVLLTGLPYLIEQTELLFHFTAPGIVEVLSNKLVSGIGVGLKIASWLTVHTQPVAQTEEGKGLKVVDEQKMPYTAKADAKEMESTKPPPPVAPEVPEKPPPEPEKKD